MNWTRTILDGLVMCAVFNLCAGWVWSLNPAIFVKSYPKSIQEIVLPTLDLQKQKRQKLAFIFLMILPLLLYGVLSAYSAGMHGFWNLALAGYVEWFLINLGDFFGLDLYFREKMGAKMVLPGTEGHEFYTRRGWMKGLGLIEHWVQWPFLVCPLAALLSAGLGTLLRAIL